VENALCSVGQTLVLLETLDPQLNLLGTMDFHHSGDSKPLTPPPSASDQSDLNTPHNHGYGSHIHGPRHPSHCQHGLHCILLPPLPWQTPPVPTALPPSPLAMSSSSRMTVFSPGKPSPSRNSSWPTMSPTPSKPRKMASVAKPWDKAPPATTSAQSDASYTTTSMAHPYGSSLPPTTITTSISMASSSKTSQPSSAWHQHGPGCHLPPWLVEI